MKKRFIVWMSIWLSLCLTLALSSEASVQVGSSLDGQRVVRLNNNDLELARHTRSHRSRSSRNARRECVECIINNFSPEVKSILHNARVEFGIDGHRMNRIVARESGGKPTADNGGHSGLFQQSERFWPGRVRDFNRANDPDVSGNIYSPVDNARVSAWMMSNGGWSHWKATDY